VPPRCDRRGWQAGAVDESPVIASAVSLQGRGVELTEERWRYIQRHVEMSGRQDTLLEAIRQPDWQEPDPHRAANATGDAAVRPSLSGGCGWL
jgi:hypothetical protein